jgi:hypothetical protein
LSWVDDERVVGRELIEKDDDLDLGSIHSRESGVALASVRDELAVSRCDASNRVYRETRVVHCRAARVCLHQGDGDEGRRD